MLGAWNKVVVVARQEDDDTMLNDALIQSRGAIGRSRLFPGGVVASPKAARSRAREGIESSV